MSNNAPDYENDLVFPPASADVHTTKLLNKPIREIQYDIKMAELKDLLKRIYEVIGEKK